MPLPVDWLKFHYAHRGLHNASDGIIENSLSAASNAIDHGYGIECDVQLSKDGEAVVFHDYDLKRLARKEASTRQLPLCDLQEIRLRGSSDTIPSLKEYLAFVRGRMPLLIELKDQSGRLEGTDGALEESVISLVSAYSGPVALMSFNPDQIGQLLKLGSGLVVGLVTSAFNPSTFPDLSDQRRLSLKQITAAEHLPISFVSHDFSDLPSNRVQALREAGVSVFCWTIRNKNEAIEAAKYTDAITFEGFHP